MSKFISGKGCSSIKYNNHSVC